MKKLTILLPAAFCIAAIGCSKDAEINEFVSQFETVTNEMTTKLDAGDVDGAQTVFDAKKELLKASFDAFKNARGFQISEDTKTKMTQSITKNATAFGIAPAKAKINAASDSEKTKKIDDLTEEYKGVFKM